MDVLIIGSGCREHALAWKIAQSPLLGRLYCAPGNAGIAAVAECVDIKAEDSAGLIAFAKARAVDFVVVGPEAPLVAGLADRLAAEGILALGPGAAGAQLEGSKGFLKDLCAEAGIPTARYRRFHEAAPAKAFAAQLGLPVVIKADGLAAGKGVIIANSIAEADEAIDAMLGGAFGAAGRELVIEEFMAGEEASFFALTDGETVLPLIGAQDHKRAFDGDTGPNTGGMGAYSPAPVFSDAIAAETLDRIIHPTVAALKARGITYRGVLYAGLMITAEGPKLIEYNCRFGDPECQVLMMRLASDLLPVLAACARGALAGHSLRWTAEAALTVVMAARGYPGAYEKGSEICGLDDRGQIEGAQIFHAATERHDGRLTAHGGRVLSVTAPGRDVEAAQKAAYAAVDRIDWPGGFCRRDIGWRAVGRR